MNSVNIYGAEKLRKVSSMKCLTGRLKRNICVVVVSMTLLVIVVTTFQTKTVDNFGRRMQVPLTGVTTWPTAVVVSNVTAAAFRGNLIKSSDQLADVDINSTRCLNRNVGNMTFPICTYETPIDKLVSGTFNKGFYWSRSIVDRFIRLLRRYADLEFVDLGANIGAFTLPAARVTHVVAVEPYSGSMARLFKSIQLGGVAKNVSLVYNAISNIRSTYGLNVHHGNIGGTNLKRLQATVNTTECRSGSCTRTILLDDLLPLMCGRRAVMKVDIEGHQPQAFTNSTAAKFFDLIDVPLLVMEWGLLCGRQQNRVRPEVRNLIRFFTDRHYQVFSQSNRPLGTDCSRWGSDVIFTKLQTREF